jgi:ribonucleotide reductase beta subunit family protein with ferritin-like domain
MHRDFACALHACLQNPCSEDKARQIIHEAVDIERTFCSEALPVDLLGMNSRDMSQYVEFVADHLLMTLGFQKMYDVTNPFEFMELISLQGKTNFFEKRVGEYKKANVSASKEELHKIHSFSTTEDF